MTSSLKPSSRSRSFPQWANRVAPLGIGVVSGTSLFVWTHQFLATFGASLPVSAGLTLALSGGAALAWWGRHRVAIPIIASIGRPVAWITVALWMVSFSGMLGAARWVMSGIPAAWLEAEGTAFSLMLAIACGLFVVPVAALSWLGCRSCGRDRARRPARFLFSTRFLLGTGLGVGAAPVALASWMSVEQIGFVIAGVSAVAFWVSLIRETETQHLSSHRASSQRLSRQHASSTSPNTSARPVSDGWSQSAWIAGVSLLVGLVLPVAHRLVMQFVPGSSFTHYALWSGLLCGVGVGAAWAARLHSRQNKTVSRDGVMVAALIAGVWPAALLLLCPLLLQGMLSLSAHVSSVTLLMAVRWLTAFVATLPLGIAAGRAWAQRETTTHEANRSAGPSAAEGGGVVGLAAGCVLMESLWVSPNIAVLLLALVSMMVVAARLWMMEGVTLRRRHWVGGAVAVALVAALPVSRHNHRPDLAAKLLFSTQTFAAHNSGIDRELLPYLDDGRLVDLRDGRDSVWTVWKHRGSQLLLRQNGIPAGVVSTNPAICPQFAADIMPAVVPLVVHPQPESVLVIGLGSTATLSTCLACPVRQVTCIEGDADLIRINDEVISAASGTNPLDDDRVRLQTIDPTLAMLADGGRYDVVMVRDSQPFLLNQTSQFTREFYERVSVHLNVGGVVCQRLQYADFGRRPVENALSTLRSVFPQVACLESAPGEMLLLASNAEELLFDESLIKRCEAAHVRRLLAQLGWDWSVMLNLSAISPQQVDELSAEDVTVNTVGNGNFAYTLPQEMMRWGPKWQEIQRLMAERGSRMLAWVGAASPEGEAEAEVQDVAKRLADMTEQQRVIVEHPDHYWAYRKTLQERLKERPRSKIVPVNHELQRALHPEDQRRKEYLEILGAAATSEAPDPASIARMTDFAEPYDPLVSYFLHEEAARLYERAAVKDHTAEFNHLRYSVHFGPQQDRSVRNVVAALELLIADPQLIPEPEQRWDEMNALLDVLRHRSMLRLQADRTASPFELVDAEKSIAVAERAMDVMDGLHAAAHVPADDWELRRTVLERMLIRPMWTYHSKQAQRLARIQAPLPQTAEVPDAEEETKVR